MTLPDNWTSPQNILVILAHPDDPEFFCGATLAKWAQEGHHITYVLLTCGDKGFNDSGLKTRPSDLFRRNCWISFEPVEGSIGALAALAGALHGTWLYGLVKKWLPH